MIGFLSVLSKSFVEMYGIGAAHLIVVLSNLVIIRADALLPPVLSFYLISCINVAMVSRYDRLSFFDKLPLLSLLLVHYLWVVSVGSVSEDFNLRQIIDFIVFLAPALKSLSYLQKFKSVFT